jgi:hypothetical protein
VSFQPFECFIACVQATGRVGKSMVADGILSWLTFAGIPHAAIDTDWQHHQGHVENPKHLGGRIGKAKREIQIPICTLSISSRVNWSPDRS